MSKIVDQTENGYIIRLNSGREKEYYNEDFLYPDPRVGDEVVVYRDKDRHLVVDLKEYYDADQQDKTKSNVQTSRQKSSRGTRSNPGIAKFLLGHKFGLLSIILAIIAMTARMEVSFVCSITGITLAIIGIIKEKKRAIPIIGLLLSCFIFIIAVYVEIRDSSYDSDQMQATAEAELSNGESTLNSSTMASSRGSSSNDITSADISNEGSSAEDHQDMIASQQYEGNGIKLALGLFSDKETGDISLTTFCTVDNEEIAKASYTPIVSANIARASSKIAKMTYSISVQNDSVQNDEMYVEALNCQTLKRSSLMYSNTKGNVYFSRPDWITEQSTTSSDDIDNIYKFILNSYKEFAEQNPDYF